MKNLMDRLFINLDPHILVNNQKRAMHPRKYNNLPYHALLAVSGFTDLDVFKPLHETLKIWEKHSALKMIGELFRPGAMSFLLEDIINKKKDIVLESLEQAGMEIIKFKKISKKTKKAVQQEVLPKPIYISGANTLFDKCIAEGKWIYKRKGIV
jgi:hypothetical protein